ncbi:MAG: PEP-CTERM sorting domain-containing protein [Alphaproteobacteria bacterium]
MYVDATQLNIVPLPAALPLFGTGLGMLGFLGWRRRRKMAAAV